MDRIDREGFAGSDSHRRRRSRKHRTLSTPPGWASGSLLWEFFVARIASPGVRHFLRESGAARASLQSQLDRACAADSVARLQEWAGAIGGGAVLFLLLAFASGCGVEARDEGGDHRVFANLQRGATPPPAPPVDAATYAWPTGEHPHAFLDVAGVGTIAIELLPELAPKAVRNFETLAAQGFFDATAFHRVIPGFMVQTGDPNTRNDIPADDGQGGPGYTIADEFSDAPHVRGVVSMANTGAPNSSGSQFFIVHEDSRHLDGKYTVFGRVVSGMEVVDAIAKVPTDKAGRWGPPDRPIEPVLLGKVTVQAAGAVDGKRGFAEAGSDRDAAPDPAPPASPAHPGGSAPN